MLGVQTLVLEKIRKMERGSIFFIDDFIDLGSPGSVRLSLMELKKQGLILRPARGIYCYPKIKNEYSGFIMPSPETIAAALAQKEIELSLELEVKNDLRVIEQIAVNELGMIKKDFITMNNIFKRCV